MRTILPFLHGLSLLSVIRHLTSFNGEEKAAFQPYSNEVITALSFLAYIIVQITSFVKEKNNQISKCFFVKNHDLRKTRHAIIHPSVYMLLDQPSQSRYLSLP